MISKSNQFRTLLKSITSLAGATTITLSLSAIPITLDDLDDFPTAKSAYAKEHKGDKDDKGGGKGDKGDKGGGKGDDKGGRKGGNKGDDKGGRKGGNKGDDKGGSEGSSKSGDSNIAPAVTPPSPAFSGPVSESLKRALEAIQSFFGGQAGDDLTDEEEADLIRGGWTQPPS